jgi:phosphohistidine swiveling domain-containing protein
LDVLGEVTGVLSAESLEVPLEGLLAASQELEAFVSRTPAGAFAARLNPVVAGEPVLRNRNKSISELVDWIQQLSVSPDRYAVVFQRHYDAVVSAVFVVSEGSAFGEVASGSLRRLTQGTALEGRYAVFDRDLEFGSTAMTLDDGELLSFVRDALERIRVRSSSERESLAARLDARFSGEFLCGYFEVLLSRTGDLVVEDYNRALAAGNALPTQQVHFSGGVRHGLLQGQTGSPGRVRGRAVVVSGEAAAQSTIPDGAVLVCDALVPEMAPLLARAGGVVSDNGCVLSHSSLVCRELRVPCVVQTGAASMAIRQGDLVEVRADSGRVLYGADGRVAFSNS